MTPSLFFSVLSLEARTRMSYRVDFWLRTVLALLAELGAFVFLAWALFAETGASEIRGFTQGGLVLYYAAVMLLGKLVAGADLGSDVSQDIYGGGLTRYLMFPRAYVPFKYAQQLGGQTPAVFQAAIFGILLFAVGDRIGATPPGPAALAMTLLSLALGNLIYFLLRLPLEMVAFWHDNVWSLVVLLRNVSRILGGATLPLAMFPGAVADILWWLPFRLVYEVPVACLLGRITPGEWLASLGLAAAWIAVLALTTLAVWRRGTLQYTGVGI